MSHCGAPHDYFKRFTGRMRVIYTGLVQARAGPARPSMTICVPSMDKKIVESLYLKHVQAQLLAKGSTVPMRVKKSLNNLADLHAMSRGSTQVFRSLACAVSIRGQ